ncbi:MAG: hypothetical protein KGJ65_12580 [Betaproteobacteria bacterium]|nr:hypothetical protein [Betaproteobacteria bacterium]MDE2124485.1 hypothetical protein [Betaproteobacteria bacterium]MDE2185358.1 hypothetical protein [Betaproteobacteria bacterium]
MNAHALTTAALAGFLALTLTGCGGGSGGMASAAGSSGTSTLAATGVVPCKPTVSNASTCTVSSAGIGAATISGTASASTTTAVTAPTAISSGSNSPAPVPSSFQSIATPWPVWQPATPVTPPSVTGKTYYVSPTGSDGNNGMSLATAFASPQHAADLVQAGDTVLIAAGTYHGTLNLINGASGVAGKPITFGSYGNGPVIIDASPVIATSAWRQVSGSVWQAPLGVTPDAVVVNSVPLRPALSAAYQATSSPPPTDASLVAPGSGLWAYTSGVLTVDFGGATPQSATVVLPTQTNPNPIYWWNKNDLVFNGLTAQGSGAGGIWGYGSNIIVSNCNAQFNDKAGINFMAIGGDGANNANNQALYNRVYQNAMLNWPRGNNGFASSGGGWSGGLVFTNSLNGLARGNVVYDNGGEGIISYGSAPGVQTGGTVFEQNVSMDNWSANMYFDNQPNDVARRNILYFSGYKQSDWIHPYDPNIYPWNTMYKFNAGLSIGDECGSSGANPCTANLANTQLYNNLIVGFRVGLAEYWEGNAMLTSSSQHGLKNTLIANNTIVMPPTTPPGTYAIGLYLWNNGTNNFNSQVVNNLIIGFDKTEPVIWYQGTGADPGVSINHNAYWNAGYANTFNLGFNQVANDTFAQWQAASGNDAQGLFGNPMLTNLSALGSPSAAPYSYLNAVPAAGSPLLGQGQALAAFSTNLAGAARTGAWSIGAF